MSNKQNANISAVLARPPQEPVLQNQLLALVLAVISCCALLKVRLDSVLHDARWIPVCETLLYVGLTLVLRLRPLRILNPIRRRVLATLFVCLPAITFVILRCLNKGEAFEILLMQFCQNISLITIGLGATRRSQQLSVLFSFFLIIFVTTLSESPLAFAFMIPYLVLGVWWLMVSHWSKLETHMPQRVESHFRIRSFSFGFTVLIILLTAGVIGWKHEPLMKTINGFMPTSGGNRFSDRYARGGVGDGDFFVAATNHASTVGPVESELFLESSKPSLFDIMEENYNGPLMPIKKKSERAFSPDDVELKHADEQLIQSEQSGRTFRILRGAKEETQNVTERRSDALFYLVGPVPIRLSLRYFDEFDGLDWSVSSKASEIQREPFSGVDVDGKFWVRFKQDQRPVSRDKEGSSRPAHPFFQEYENHSIKVMRLDTNRVLQPSSISAWHFDKCDDARFFRWTADGAIEFSGRDSIPELAVYHLVSRGVNFDKLRSFEAATAVRQRSPFAQVGDISIKTRLREIALRLTRNAKTDWEKVDRIVEHLRSEYRLSSTRVQRSKPVSPQSGEFVIEDFLENREGPDYMFATVGALLIRSLDMEARLVNGFYVDRRDFDAYSDQSIVDADNFHFWVEVRVNGQDWITVEPSPGFAPPRGKFTWGQQIARLVQIVITWITHHPVLLLGIAVSLVIVWLFRIRLMMGCLVLIWFIERIGSRRRIVLATFRLAHRRRLLLNQSGNVSVADLCSDYRQIDSPENSKNASEMSLCFGKAINQLLYHPNPKLDNPNLVDRACWTIAWTRPTFEKTV